MATISCEMNPQWLGVRVAGVLRYEEMLAVIDAHYPINCTGRTIWILLEANLDQIRLKDFQEIARHAALRYPGNYKKTAYVGRNEVFSQICMCSAIAAMENEGIDYCAFQDVASAERWILQNAAFRAGTAMSHTRASF